MSDDDSWLKKHAGQVIAGVFGLVGVVIAGIFGLLGGTPPGSETSSASTTTTQAAPTTTSTTTSTPADCDQQFQITSPVNGTKISASQGVLMEGTACESDLIWVLDYDPDNGSYFQVNNEPLQITGEKWLQINKPIGDPADEIGTAYTIVVIRATQACSDLMRTTAPDEDGTVRFDPLPLGCPGLEDKSNIRSVQVLNSGP